MNEYFNVLDLEEELEQNGCFADNFEMAQTFRVQSLKKLTKRLPEPGEIFFIETMKSFSAFTFIVHVLKETGHIDKLYIATYSTNDRIISALVRYKGKGLIDNIHLHISETIKYRMPLVYDRLIELQEKGVLELTTAWSHMKVTCMATEKGYYVVEGSGNYGENALQEQYVFLNSRNVYEFRTAKSS